MTAPVLDRFYLDRCGRYTQYAMHPDNAYLVAFSPWLFVTASGREALWILRAYAEFDPDWNIVFAVPRVLPLDAHTAFGTWRTSMVSWCMPAHEIHAAQHVLAVPESVHTLAWVDEHAPANIENHGAALAAQLRKLSQSEAATDARFAARHSRIAQTIEAHWSPSIGAPRARLGLIAADTTAIVSVETPAPSTPWTISTSTGTAIEEKQEMPAKPKTPKTQQWYLTLVSYTDDDGDTVVQSVLNSEDDFDLDGAVTDIGSGFETIAPRRKIRLPYAADRTSGQFSGEDYHADAWALTLNKLEEAYLATLDVEDFDEDAMRENVGSRYYGETRKERLKTQARAAGEAMAFGAGMVVVDQAGELFLNVARLYADRAPLIKTALESETGRELLKLAGALVLQTMVHQTDALPYAKGFEKLAELQLASSSNKLIAPHIGDLRQLTEAFMGLGKAMEEGTLPALGAGAPVLGFASELREKSKAG